jgi:tetratricopeptide (TPR) repeat protein
MRYGLFLLINVCISVVIAILLWRFLPKKFQQPKWPIIFWFFFISVCLPIVGWLFLIVVTILSYWFEREVPKKIIKKVFAPKFRREKISASTGLGEGGAWMHWQHRDMSDARHLRAMFAVNVAQAATANIVNLEMLQAGSDQLRLYAFGLINKQSKKLDQYISELKQELEKGDVLVDKTKVKKSLAFLYWEMVFAKLVQDDLLAYSINEAVKYATEALKEIPNDVGLWILLGRIYFYQKEFAKAKAAFEKVDKSHVFYVKVVPYLAELSFKERDYAKVREYLGLYEVFMRIPKLHGVVKFWRTS